eukprot:11161023-Alexandrium_andersonii.AAC.1
MAPRPQALPGFQRPRVDLRVDRALTKRSLDMRAESLALFSRWVLDFTSMPLAQVMQAPPKVVSRLLAAFGQHVYDTGRSRSSFLRERS